MPSKGKAIGWRVGTYWADSATFYEGEVVGYDNASGRHHLVYDSGEQEHVLLTSVKVCAWEHAVTSDRDECSAMPASIRSKACWEGLLAEGMADAQPQWRKLHALCLMEGFMSCLVTELKAGARCCKARAAVLAGGLPSGC